ncbi:kinase-like domain-containing protein [Mycena floridula]|nr:kinase-like domain-containing protein [Mycena floridula]
MTSSKGSFRWMAPELLIPSDISPRSRAQDIYAFGCTVLEIFTRLPPFFYHRSDAVILHEVLAGKRPRRPVNIQGFSDAMWTLVQACWSQVPSARPIVQTVLSVLDLMKANRP